MAFNLKYFLFAILLLIVEVCIALFVHDEIIRPYVGDYLVVIMIYCFVRSFVNKSPWIVAAGVLLFAFSIEILQYFSIVDRLGLSDNIIAKTVIGYGFDWWDMLAYVLGVATVLLIEQFNKPGYSGKKS